MQKRGAPAHLRTRRGGPPGLRGGVRWGEQGFEESRGEISSTCYALFRGDAGADGPSDPLGPCRNQDLCAPKKPQDGGLLPFFFGAKICTEAEDFRPSALPKKGSD